VYDERVFKNIVTTLDSTANFDENPRAWLCAAKRSTIFIFSDSNETSKSDSNFVARDCNDSKTVVPKLLKQKKIKEKKHKANRISSLNTMNSKKHKTEKIKRDTIKNKSNIKN